MTNRRENRPGIHFLSLVLAWCALGLPVAGSGAFAQRAAVRWQFEAGGKIIAKPTLEGQTIYVAGGSTLHAVSVRGEELWRRQLDGTLAARARVHDGRIYLHSSEGLHALEGRGEPLWTYQARDEGPLVDGRTWGWGAEILSDPWGWYRSAPLLDDDTVYFGDSDGVHAVAKDTGEARWRVPIGPVTADPVAYRDLVVVAGWNHSVYGLERETGKVRWRFRAQVPYSKGVDWVGYTGFHLTPVLDGDRLFVGNRNTYFYALDAGDGTEAWSAKVGASWMGSPAVLSEHGVYYGLSDGKAVLGHRKDTGALSLFFQAGSLVFAQPELHGERLIVGTISGHLFAVDTADGRGELLLHFGPETPRYAEFFEAENRPDGLSAYDANAFAIERLLTESSSILNLTVEGDTAFVGTATGTLYAVDLGPAGAPAPRR